MELGGETALAHPIDTPLERQWNRSRDNRGRPSRAPWIHPRRLSHTPLSGGRRCCEAGLLLFGGLCGVLPLDTLVNLLTMHRDALWRVDADTHLISLDPQNGDGHVVPDHDGLTHAPCKNQHTGNPL